MKSKVTPIKGIVTEALSGGRYTVQMGDLKKICYLSGKMKFNHIQVNIGDPVEVVLDPYGGHGTDRIVKRL